MSACSIGVAFDCQPARQQNCVSWASSIRGDLAAGCYFAQHRPADDGSRQPERDFRVAANERDVERRGGVADLLEDLLG